MIWKMVWKYLAGAVILAALGFGVWMYGNSRESDGYDRRDTEAKIELGKRQTALYEEQMKNERLREENDRRVQALKAETEVELARGAAISDRLRITAANAIRERNEAIAAGRVTDQGADWIGVFASCQSEYGMLGKDAARIANKLRGLQDAIDPQ